MTTTTVPDRLEALAALFEERNKDYKNNYKEFGHWASQLFPDGLTVKTPHDWSKLGMLIQVMSKLSRFTQTFHENRPSDSLSDLAVYSVMLQEVLADEEIAERNASMQMDD